MRKLTWADPKAAKYGITTVDHGHFEFYARSRLASELTQMTIHSETTLTD
jgi:hypothetical protein